MTPVHIRAADAADAAALSALAARTFAAAFGADNTPEDLAHYLAGAFSPERQAAEIADPAGAVLLAELPGDATTDGATAGDSTAGGSTAGGSTAGDSGAGLDTAPGRAPLVGYAHLVASPAPAAVAGPDPLELKRLYVDAPWHGRGVAQALMDAALRVAAARGARTLWLGVWERNPRAAAFYAKYGFARVGAHAFRVGGDVQTDWLLARPLGGGLGG